MNTKVLFAVFKRNLLGYFTNPTGYVFICVFVLLCSVAAFLPYEFFNANLASLHQLNAWVAMIMIVFIPAITMSIWAEERRQGTDELLLTIPASNFDIVLGKYLAAVSVFTVSLLFSMICNYLVLSYLGNPDSGLFLTTYFGYWLVGLAMLAIGMVASFLTSNLTVAYILGAAFNVPLVALQWFDALPFSSQVSEKFISFSIFDQFGMFGRGIISLSHLVYFIGILATMLYISIVLIGRRHWTANQSFLGWCHYGVRIFSLLMIGFCLCLILRHYDLRLDMTAEKLSSLSKQSIGLIKEIEPEHTVIIDAFISPEVPKEYVQTRLNLISILNEIDSRSGSKVTLRIHRLEHNTEEAARASQQYGIEPQNVVQRVRGAIERKWIFLGVSMRCGLKKVNLPFIEPLQSVEYELIHALSSVAEVQKKRIGILKTDAYVMGGADTQSYRVRPEWKIVEELKRQYIVIDVDPVEPITEKFDALLAIQPSALGIDEFENFMAVVRSGQKTVIFEDPLPDQPFRGTGFPRVMNTMMGPRNLPKGDIHALWSLLGVNFESDRIIWQAYNPYPRYRIGANYLIFLDQTSGGEDGKAGTNSAFNRDDEITRSLRSVMLLLSGAISKTSNSKMEYTPLLQTSHEPVGHYEIAQLTAMLQQGRSSEDASVIAVRDKGPLDLAVRIRGDLPAPPSTPAPEGTPAPKGPKLDVILVADVDFITDFYYMFRSSVNDPESGEYFDFDNATFLLNAIDSLIGDERYIDLRTRRPIHRTLVKFDKATKETRDKADEQRQKHVEEYKKLEKEINEKAEEEIAELKEEVGDDYISLNDPRLAARADTLKKFATVRMDNLRMKRDREIAITDIELYKEIDRIQTRYKLYAVLLPPILPLLVALIVFIVRRVKEYEGVPESRRT